MVRLKAIHVPFGKTPNFSFQFLMVRLKAFIYQFFQIRSDISIPYGAIKSNQVGGFRYATSVFQFLMVRLKDIKRLYK